MRSRKNTYREQLEVRLQEAKRAESVPPTPTTSAPPPAPPPAPPETEFSDPSVELADARLQLSEIRRELNTERERRRAAESRATALEADRPSAASGAMLASLAQKKRRALWK